MPSTTEIVDDLVKLIGPVDTRSIVTRALALVCGGEAPGSVLERLNGPARVPLPEITLREPERPLLDRTLIEYPKVRPFLKPALQAVCETLRCGQCGSEYVRARKRGRKPQTGPCCR